MLKPRVGRCRATGRDRGLDPVHPSAYLGYGFGVGPRCKRKVEQVGFAGLRRASFAVDAGRDRCLAATVSRAHGV